MLLQHLKYHLLSLLQQLHVYKCYYFRRPGFCYPPYPHIFATNSTTAIIFLILIQLEDIISSFDVTVISVFIMFSWSLFFNSGSSSFTGLIDYWSQNHVFSEDQRKAGPLNHLCILLKSTGYIISRTVMCWYILPLLNICVVLDEVYTISDKNFISPRFIINVA